MGYIKEPKGVDFVIEPIPLTPEDKQMISKAIALYKATGKITKAARGKKTRKPGKNVKH
jgi:alpha-galactosidase